ncbi:amino acid permease, partial [Pseudomonas aeruginosa]
LFSKPSVVNRGTAQRMEHYPTVGIGDIFRGH